MSIEQESIQTYYGFNGDEPILEPLDGGTTLPPSPAPAPIPVMATPSPAPVTGVTDQLMLSFMVFGAIIVVVTVFGFALMYRSR